MAFDHTSDEDLIRVRIRSSGKIKRLLQTTVNTRISQTIKNCRMAYYPDPELQARNFIWILLFSSWASQEPPHFYFES